MDCFAGGMVLKHLRMVAFLSLAEDMLETGWHSWDGMGLAKCTLGIEFTVCVRCFTLL